MAGSKWINTPSTPNPIDLKIEEWWKNISVYWLWRVITNTWDALYQTFSTWLHLGWAWVSKVTEYFTDKNDKKLLTSRQNVTNHHMNKAKNSGEKAIQDLWQVIWWTLKTVKWVWQIGIHSGRKTVQTIRWNLNKKAPTTGTSSKKKTTS